MAKFSLEDGEGPSFPRSKRQRPSSPSPPPPPPPDFTMEEIVREDEESDEDEEEDHVDTSDGSEEEDEDEEEEEPVEETVRPQPPPPPPQQQQQRRRRRQDQPPPRPHENNQITTVRLQPPQRRLFEASNFLGHNLAGPSRNGAIIATLSDPEVLDCPICCEPLTIPIFQFGSFGWTWLELDELPLCALHSSIELSKELRPLTEIR